MFKNKLIVLITIYIFIQVAESSITDHYCGDFNCYDLLKVDNDSSTDQIKKAYRTLTKKFHPDIARAKGQEDTTQVFQRINQAYEVLGNAKLRKTYDQYLANPDKGNMYHYYNYYKAVYLPQTDPTAVITTFICLLTLIQYAGRKTMYQRAQHYVLQSDKFQKEVRNRLQDESNTLSKSEIIKQLQGEVKIGGGWSEPKIQEMLAIKIIILPYTIIMKIYRSIRWYIRYNIKKLEYTEEDKYIITKYVLEKTPLKMNEAKWFMLGEEEQEYIVQRQLWIPENLEEYLEEQKIIEQEEKAKFMNSAKGKQYKRYMKNKR